MAKKIIPTDEELEIAEQKIKIQEELENSVKMVEEALEIKEK